MGAKLMSTALNGMNVPGRGTRQQRAEELRREMERQVQFSTAPGKTSTGANGSVEQGETRPHADATDNEPVAAANPGEGSKKHTVRDGDCLNSIAEHYGFQWKYLWNLPENAALKAKRQDPDVLLPGDEVTIPPLRRKDESGQSEMRHLFRRLGQPVRLVLLFKIDDEPRAAEPYRLIVDGRTWEGTTDGEGMIDVVIPARSRQGKIMVGAGIREKTYRLRLGGLDPYNSVKGVQTRLKHLGYDVGHVDGRIGPQTRKAVRGFQANQELPITGDLDEATCAALRLAHGS
jgi:N-acetylmuramoyl-L-alanine amidase